MIGLSAHVICSSRRDLGVVGGELFGSVRSEEWVSRVCSEGLGMSKVWSGKVSQFVGSFKSFISNGNRLN